MSYRYRNLPARTEAGFSRDWCVTGHDTVNDGSGVLEWCNGKTDAHTILHKMRGYAGQFARLQVRKYSDLTRSFND